MTYETLGDFESQSSLEDVYSSSDMTTQMPYVFRGGMGLKQLCSLSLLFIVFHFAPPLLPSTQLLGYEEKHQNHRSVENEPTGAHGPSGAAHHWTFSMWLPLFLHLSSSPPSLLGKLEIGVKVYTVPRAAR